MQATHNPKTIRAAVAVGIFGLVVRFAVWPFAEQIFPDAYPRIVDALEWLEHPWFITAGVWGPLHTYALAFALFLYDNPVVAPQALHALASSAAGVFFYLFVRNAFGPAGAFATACAFQLYPVLLRYSLVAASESLVVLFVTAGMYFVERSRDGAGTLLPAAIGGIAITLACATRYEPWVLVPLFALVLWPRWKALVVFLIAAGVFPVYWMVGNAVANGDAFYFLHAAKDFQVRVEGINDEVGRWDILMRVAFFPWALFWGLTPLVAVGVLAGAWLAVKQSRGVAVWFVPPLVLLVVTAYQAVTGALFLQSRYSIILGTLALPFLAPFFAAVSRRTAVSAVIIASMIPLSYGSSIFPVVPPDIQTVPRLAEPRLAEIARTVDEIIAGPEDGLIIDFFGWTETRMVALEALREVRNVFLVEGGKHQEIDWRRLAAYAARRPSGVLVLAENSRFARVLTRSDGGFSHPMLEGRFEVEQTASFADLIKYEYGTVKNAPFYAKFQRISAPYTVDVYVYRFVR